MMRTIGIIPFLSAVLFAAPCAGAGGPTPANDLCANATVIPGNVVTYNPALLDTTGATNSTCDAAESCEGGVGGVSNSVWYIYSPTLSGTVAVNTLGSNYNTVLSVWTDSCGMLGPKFTCENLPTQMACNDDYLAGNTSQVFLTVQAGITYRIKVADFDAGDGGGLLDFNLLWKPPNDLCANATVIPCCGLYDPPVYGTANATGEQCESEEGCEFNGVGVSNAVWYRFISLEEGVLELKTEGSGYDTVLSVWDKCGEFYDVDYPCNASGSTPVQIDCDDDSGLGTTSLINLAITGGVEYFIKVADYNMASGGGSLDFNALFTPLCVSDIAPLGGDGAIGVPDLLKIINDWGPCP